MSSFEYTIRDENGLHARPAGLLVRQAQALSSEITIECRGKSASLKKLLAVMGLGVRCGDVVKISAEGKNAEEDLAIIKDFLQKNF
ncbi:MAG: HPr family phosphocarrier protein [Clostridia bacterium]|nr:HPr family phosphocarrier protein [Clostridia bacterium]